MIVRPPHARLSAPPLPGHEKRQFIWAFDFNYYSLHGDSIIIYIVSGKPLILSETLPAPGHEQRQRHTVHAPLRPEMRRRPGRAARREPGAVRERGARGELPVHLRHWLPARREADVQRGQLQPAGLLRHQLHGPAAPGLSIYLSTYLSISPIYLSLLSISLSLYTYTYIYIYTYMHRHYVYQGWGSNPDRANYLSSSLDARSKQKGP